MVTSLSVSSMLYVGADGDESCVTYVQKSVFPVDRFPFCPVIVIRYQPEDAASISKVHSPFESTWTTSVPTLSSDESPQMAFQSTLMVSALPAVPVRLIVSHSFTLKVP